MALRAICVTEVSVRLAGDVGLNADPPGRFRFSSVVISDTFADAANGQNPFKHLYPLCGTRKPRIENRVENSDEGAQNPEEDGHGYMLDRKGHFQSRPMKLPARAMIIHDEHGRRVQQDNTYDDASNSEDYIAPQTVCSFIYHVLVS